MATKAESVLVTMPMGIGVDESIAPEVLDPNQGFLVLENCRQTKRGAIEKRRGFTSVTSARLTSPGTSRATCVRLLANNGNICAVDSGGLLDAFSTQAGAWKTIGMLPECMVSRETTANTMFSATGIAAAWKCADAVEVNGYRIVASNFYDNVIATVYDAATGACVFPPTKVGATLLSHDIQVVAATNAGNTRAHVIFANAAGTTVYRATFNTAAIATGWSAATALFATMSSQKSFDAGSFGASWGVVLTSGTNQVTIATYQDDGTLIASATPTSTAVLRVSIAGSSSDVLWIGVSNITNARVFGVNPTTLATTVSVNSVITVGSTCVQFAVTWVSAGVGVAAAQDVSGNTRTRIFWNVSGFVTPQGVDGAPLLMNTSLASRPWVHGGRTQLAVTPRQNDVTPNAQKTLLVIDVTDCMGALNLLPRVVATIAPRVEVHNTEQELTSTTFKSPCHTLVSGDIVKLPIMVLRSPLAASVEVAVLDYANSEAYSAAEYQGVSLIGTGLTSSYDGTRCVEANWAIRPQIDTVSPTGAGAITTTGTGWTYVAVFEWLDARGNMHRSAPSDPVRSGAFTSKASVNINVQPLLMTNRQTDITDAYSGVSVTLYRTINTGSTFYRCSTKSNATFSNTLLFNDALLDAALIQNEQLYSQPGLVGTTQPHANPPCLRHVITHRDRLIGVGDDGCTLWPSAPYVYGEGTWWGDVFQLPISEGGKITALASQDGRLYAFKRDRIFVIDGDGPSENGAAGEFSQPAKLPTALGCISHRSIAVAPGGIFFQSSRGIEVLSRGGGVQWVGERVQSTLALYPTVTSAVTREEEGRVYFTCVSAVGTSGVTLVFDYAISDVGAWSVDKFYDSELTSATGPASHALSIYGDYYRSSGTTGRVWREYAYSLDNSFWITMAIETAWVKPAGVHGKTDISRAILIGKKEDNCNVVVRWSYDYRDTFEDAETTEADIIDAVNTDMGRVHVETFPDNNRQCMSAKLRIEDATPTNTGLFPTTTAKGVTWFGYTIEAQTKPGGVDLPETARG